MLKKWKSRLASLVAVSMCLSTVNVQVYANANSYVEEKEVEDNYTENIELSEQDETENLDKEIILHDYLNGTLQQDMGEELERNASYKSEQDVQEDVYEGDNFKVTFTVYEKWENGYNANVKIENTGTSTIENWILKIDYPDDINYTWNTKEIANDKKIVLKNSTWNQDIPVSGYVEFGIQGKNSFKEFPKSYSLISEKTTTNKKDYMVEYQVNVDWEAGFTATVTITNMTSKIIEDWILECEYDRQIDSIWNAEIIQHIDNKYVIKNLGYNANIFPNESITFGFCGSEGTIDDEPFNYKLEEWGVDDNKDAEDVVQLEDIGEIYFKQLTADDIVLDEESCISYAKSQILVSAQKGVKKEVIEDITNDISARIVGYIELSNDYQVEFIEEKTMDELNTYINYLESFSFIDGASLNFVMEEQPQLITTNDELYNDNKMYRHAFITTDDSDDIIVADGNENPFYNGCDDWDEENPYGDNWGLEALRVPSAWEYCKNNLPVKVGVVDRHFYNNKEVSYNELSDNHNLHLERIGHGLCVSSIICAKHNNNYGIAGITTNSTLYTYTLPDSYYVDKSKEKYASSCMEKMVAFATLIGNHVKVINYSFGYAPELAYALNDPVNSEKQVLLKNKIRMVSDVMQEFLLKMILSGYDFIICTSAGNYNGETTKMVKDESEPYGFRKAKPNETSYYIDTLDAKFNNEFTYIDLPYIRNRIIVVGSIDVNFNISSFSHSGVDFVAPGQDVLTPINETEFSLIDGTSYSSPYIAGLVGLMYQVNPQLQADDVKLIIDKSCTKYCKYDKCRVGSDRSKLSYKLPNAEECCRYVKENGKSLMDNDIELPSGIVCGEVIFPEGVFDKEKDRKADFTAIRNYSGESNIDAGNNTYMYKFYSDKNEGTFFQPLQQGTYTILVSREGYLPFTINNVTVNADETVVLDDIVMTKWNKNLFSSVQGKVNDALDGECVEGVTVRFRKGWNNQEGSYVTDIIGHVKEDVTKSDGLFSVMLNSGSYTVELQKDGYVTGYYNIVSNEKLFSSESEPIPMVLSPLLSEDEYRIVLTWGSEPSDLDSHLTYYIGDKQQFHVSYQNKEAVYEGKIVAQLDLDDTSSYGPETVTILLDSGIVNSEGYFNYSVHNYSDKGILSSNRLSLSNAVVRVFKGNTLLRTYNVPKNEAGTVWHVFAIKDGKFVTKNRFYDNSDVVGIE